MPPSHWGKNGKTLPTSRTLRAGARFRRDCYTPAQLKNKTHTMQIRIHTCGGLVETFFQDDPTLVARILKGAQSTKVFATNIITIAGEYSLTSFDTAKINRVDLITNDSLSWKHTGDILDVVELSEDEFRERSHLND